MEKKNVMIRTYSAGVHFGTLIHKEYTPAGIVVVLENARRIYKWRGANTLSCLSTAGSSDIEGCEITMPVAKIELVAIEIIDFAPDAYEQLNGCKFWKTSDKTDDQIKEIVSELL